MTNRNTGFIAIQREHIPQDLEGLFYLHLLKDATFRHRETVLKNKQPFHLKKGQLLYNRTEIAKRLEVSPKQLRTWEERLTKKGFLSLELIRGRGSGVATLPKYEEHTKGGDTPPEERYTTPAGAPRLEDVQRICTEERLTRIDPSAIHLQIASMYRQGKTISSLTNYLKTINRKQPEADTRTKAAHRNIW